MKNIFKYFAQKALIQIDNFRDLGANKYFQSLSLGVRGFIFTKGNSIKFVTKGYQENLDIYSITSRIARVASSIPIKLYDVQSDGSKIEVTDSGLNQLLICPNRLQVWNEFCEEALTYLLLTGNEYAAGTRAVGMGDVFRELNNLPAHITIPISGDVINPIAHYIVQFDHQVKYDFDEVIHLKYMNPASRKEDALVGMSPLMAGNKTMESSNLLQIADASLLENGGASGLITNDSELAMRPGDQQDLQDKWDDIASGAMKRGKIIAHTGNLRYVKIGMSNEDLKLIESDVLKLRKFCNLYAVSSQLFNDPSNKSFNNYKTAQAAFYTDAVIPVLKKLIAGFNVGLVPEWSKHDKKNYVIEIDTSEIEFLQEDQEKKAQRTEKTSKEVREIQKNVAMGQASAQGARASLELIHGFSEKEANKLIIEPKQN